VPETPKFTRRSMIAAAASAVTGTVLAQTMALTPSNPEGPFYPKVVKADRDTDLTLINGHRKRAEGQVIRVTGEVLDHDGQPVEGALVDIWQANAHGRYDHPDDPAAAPLDPDFQGRGVVRTDARGRYSFVTIKPGAYAAGGEGDWQRPPHIHFKVSHKDYEPLTTQMYFAGESLNDADRLLQSVPEEERELLIVEFDESGSVPRGHFPIVLARAG
jgi:protocatechuate 3,4-dioxygenase beta subunit